MSRPRRDPTDERAQLQLLLTSPEQHAHEVLRPVVMFAQPSFALARETRISERTRRRQIANFNTEGGPDGSPELVHPPGGLLDDVAADGEVRLTARLDRFGQGPGPAVVGVEHGRQEQFSVGAPRKDDDLAGIGVPTVAVLALEQEGTRLDRLGHRGDGGLGHPLAGQIEVGVGGQPFDDVPVRAAGVLRNIEPGDGDDDVEVFVRKKRARGLNPIAILRALRGTRATEAPCQWSSRIVSPVDEPFLQGRIGRVDAESFQIL